MSNFIPSVQKTIEFEGDKVSVVLRPFVTQAFFKVMPAAQKYNEEIRRIKKEKGIETIDENEKDIEAVDENEIDPAIRAELMRVSAEALPEHVDAFNGLKDAHGDEVNLDAALENMYFMPLVAQLINELITISNLGRTPKEEKAAIKNSERQPQDNSPVRGLKARA